MHGDLGSRRVSSRSQQIGLEELVVQVLADEHHLTDASLVRRPGLIRGAEVDLLVHTLEHELDVSLVSEGAGLAVGVAPGEVGREAEMEPQRGVREMLTLFC